MDAYARDERQEQTVIPDNHCTLHSHHHILRAGGGRRSRRLELYTRKLIINARLYYTDVRTRTHTHVTYRHT